MHVTWSEKWKIICAVLAVLATSRAETEINPLSIGLKFEFGPVVRGTYQYDTGPIVQLRNEWVDHFGGYFIQSITVNERTDLVAGIGGSWQYRKPEVFGTSFESSNRPNVFLGPIGLISHKFGDVDDPFLHLQFGGLNYKYNSNSNVLGEYLFRSSPYPTLLRTGGYGVTGSSRAFLRGLKLGLQLGPFTTDLLLTTETSMPPLFDLSLGLVSKYSVLDGFAEIGAGVLFKSLIPINPEKTTPEDPTDPYFNAYFYHEGRYIYADRGYYTAYRSFYETKLFQIDSVIQNEITPGSFDYDSIYQNGLTAEITTALANHNIDANSVLNYVNGYQDWDSAVVLWDDSLENEFDSSDAVGHYTFQGTTVMGMASLDVQKLVRIPFLGERDLRMYCEVNLLGLEDQPIFYEDKRERMPIVFGINLPAFKLLDLLSFEYEIFDNPYLNNSYGVGKANSAAPYIPSNVSPVNQNEFLDGGRKDNRKWAIMAEKKMFSNLMFRAQTGRTHLQLAGTAFFFGPQFGTQEVTTLPDDWYWMLAVEWGL